MALTPQQLHQQSTPAAFLWNRTDCGLVIKYIYLAELKIFSKGDKSLINKRLPVNYGLRFNFIRKCVVISITGQVVEWEL